ncbi:helix-turn-helix transcriptional regulator [Sinorhizobium numidicum]|uniref:Helix-turn-helix transcriptional regulator n=1 Tax=Sinorhizobium numidicum TaxID=680248 RepID=A0ABY8D1A5_9HYPH|nr:helix-turn-helix transcriptional regulator [Sinorhizobium numidicum]WEX76659.1 helix-turn-helix transcriptional regulator [Sinorhizobium numidicum]WEX83320.1 helix-turn-helix transcriptional regulator [Sinorhizobium numidicum]
MQKTLGSRGHEALVALLIEKRKTAGLTQDDLARAVGEHQSFVARLESGQRRIDVIEYIALAEVMGFDAAEALKQLISEVAEEKML